MSRPAFIAPAVTAWGEPTSCTDEEVAVKGRVDRGGYNALETRYVRSWRWEESRGLARGVQCWHTGHRTKDPTTTIEAHGPLGTVTLVHPGSVAVPSVVSLCMMLAGVPADLDLGMAAFTVLFEAQWERESEPDLTNQLAVNYAQGSSIAPTEGEHVSEIENAGTEATDAVEAVQVDDAATDTDTAEDDAAADAAGE